MATVLIIPTDPLIGGLVGQLADLAGHAAQFRPAGEEAGEAVRRTRPDVVMLDAAYGVATIDTISAAAADVGASVVYFASTLGPAELRRLALERGAKYFTLPAGPRLLGRVLADAVAHPSPNGRVHGPRTTASAAAQYAVAAAVAAVARARTLAAQAASLKTESRTLRAEHEAAVAECRRTQAGLREAVIAYTRELRGEGVPPDKALELVRTALRSELARGRPAPDLGRDLDDAVEWCLQAYYAA